MTGLSFAGGKRFADARDWPTEMALEPSRTPNRDQIPSTHRQKAPQKCGSAPNAQKRRFAVDCVVPIEPSLQNPKNRNNREKYRENRKFGLKLNDSSTRKCSIHAGFKQNSLSKFTGNDFGVTGKLSANNGES